MNTFTLRIEDNIWDSKHQRYGNILSVDGKREPYVVSEEHHLKTGITYTDGYNIFETCIDDIDVADGKTYCIKWYPRVPGDCEPSYSYVGAHNDREVRRVLGACFSKVDWVEFYEVDSREQHYCDYRVRPNGDVVRG